MPGTLDVSSSQLEDLAKEAAGSWRKMECFCWFGEPDDSENWCIVYTHNRDSDVLDQSNAAAIVEEMKPFVEDGTAVPEEHSHWACGWISGYSIRVYDAQGQITPAFKKWNEIQDRLEDYPVLDDSDLNEREHEDAIERIQWLCPSDAICGLPDDWAEEVSSWLWEHNIGDGEFGEDEVWSAFKSLGWLEDEFEDE
jgi:hypothetical protein